MDATERLVRTWMASSRDQEIEATVSGISKGETNLLNVVKALGEYLTAEEDEIRTKGVEFLSAVLARCPADKLNRQSVRVLVTFYIGKLEDTETIVPALKGLVTLSSLPPFISSDAIEVVRALFAHVKMRALVQLVRYNVFAVFDSIMARHREALKNMDSEFLSGYINLADGEKDPRNLMVAFAIARVIGVEFDVSKHAENLFNIIFCYFPITFRPPPDDPYGITSEDLKKSLQACLAATPAFGPMAIPLFIEKLTAGSPATKRDTLQTLSICMPVYGAAVVLVHAKKLWNTLRLEIFQPTDAITEEEALKTTQDMIKVIYPPSSAENAMQEDIQGLAKEICEECLKLLREPEKSQATPAAKVLNAFLATTPPIMRFALSQAIPHLLRIFADPDEVSNRAATLAHLSNVVFAARDKSCADPGSPAPILAPYKDEVLGAFTSGLKIGSSSPPALRGLDGLVTTKGLLTDEELGYIVHNVNDLLQGDSGEDVSDAALDLLSAISATTPKHVEHLTLPLLFGSLPDTPLSRDAGSERQRCWCILAYLGKLCVQPALFETLVIRLSTKVDLVVSSTVETSDAEPGVAYIHAILHTLANVITKKVAKSDPDVPKYVDRLLPHLFNHFISSACTDGGGSNAIDDARLINVVAEIVTQVLQTASAQKQSSFLEALFSAYLRGDASLLLGARKSISNSIPFMPLTSNAPSSQKSLIPLFAAAVVTSHKETLLPVEDLSDFLRSLILWSINDAENVTQRSAIWRIGSSIINKRADDLTAFLSSAKDTFWPEQVAHASNDPAKRRHAISAWVWITKGLLVRNHPSSTAFAEQLFDLFNDVDSEVAWDAARAVGEIGSADDTLTKRNHAIIRMLWAQKYCNLILPKVIEGSQNPADRQLQTAYLVALASLIKSVPKSTYSDRMPELLPLLIRGLDLPDPHIRASVIDTLYASASATSKDSKTPEQGAVSEHASTLVSAMLKNARVKENPSVRVRVAALRYLGRMPSVVRYDVLHPQKGLVLRELASILDDPKKAVRKEAVDARSTWFTAEG